ncbi:hypothetical protein TKK_0004755 [Trichogramma kaykai]
MLYNIIKVLADDWQGFFKISVAVLTEEELTKSHEYENQRVPYFAGASITKKSNLNSVYRLILLCIVPRIKESDDNMKILIELSKHNDIPFKFCQTKTKFKEAVAILKKSLDRSEILTTDSS